jgi:hypothetical protein
MFGHDKSTYTQLEKEIKLLIQGDRISSVKNLHPNMMSQFMNLLSNTVHWNVLASALCTQGRPIFDGLTRMLRMLAPVRSFHHKKRYDWCIFFVTGVTERGINLAGKYSNLCATGILAPWHQSGPRPVKASIQSVVPHKKGLARPGLALKPELVRQYRKVSLLQIL